MIEWQTAGSWNPVVGCSMVSPGCQSCYAMKQAWRNFRFGTRGYENVVKATPQGARWTGNVNFMPSQLAKPLTRRKPSIWFVNSMSDLFHENVTNEQIAAVMGVIMATAARSQHYVVLTKRIERVPQWLKWIEQQTQACERDATNVCRLCAHGHVETAAQAKAFAARLEPQWPPKNLWIGPSIENQETCDQRLLVACELGRLGFNVVLSIEPLLGPVTLNADILRRPVTRLDNEQAIINERRGIKTFAAPQYTTLEPVVKWVLLGGESDQGADARPYDINWARAIIKQCGDAKIPLFHKQIGSNPINVKLTNPGIRGENTDAWPEDLCVRQAPERLRQILEAAQRLAVPKTQNPEPKTQATP